VKNVLFAGVAEIARPVCDLRCCWFIGDGTQLTACARTKAQVIYIIFKGEFIYYCELAAFMPYAAADVNNSPKLALQHASSAASGK